ncbi:MAG: hypothetical protein P8P29_05575 [Flavobacteriaceae bacterium]|nr:hypothetical protein [Flavobacteriaceae bacterium]
MSDKDNVPKKRGRGRPRKTEVEAKKKRGVVGRPPGEASRIKEFHARLLATSGETVINTIITKALDNDDKDQVACLKMCIDRVLPMSYFDKGKDAGRGSVNIQISMVGDKKAEVLEQEEPQDIEYETVDVRPED